VATLSLFFGILVAVTQKNFETGEKGGSRDICSIEEKKRRRGGLAVATLKSRRTTKLLMSC
jgi:hypothetical protein